MSHMPTTIGRPARPATRWRRAACVAVLLAVVAGCGGTSNGNGNSAASGEQDRSLTLYTCLNDTSIQPVITPSRRPGGGQVDLFRAPTGELNARVAADARSGGLRADVVWGCDPLTLQAFVDQHLVGGWLPPEADGDPGEFRTDDYVGAHVLYLVAVHRTDVPAPATWSDLAGRAIPRSRTRPRRSPPRARRARLVRRPARATAATSTAG